MSGTLTETLQDWSRECGDNLAILQSCKVPVPGALYVGLCLFYGGAMCGRVHYMLGYVCFIVELCVGGCIICWAVCVL